MVKYARECYRSCRSEPERRHQRCRDDAIGPGHQDQSDQAEAPGAIPPYSTRAESGSPPIRTFVWKHGATPMKTRLLFPKMALCGLLILLAAGSANSAVAPVATVRGRLVHKNGAPAAGISVTISCEKGARSAPARTGSDGMYYLSNIAPGKLFLHYNGSYHSDYYEGIMWYLKRKNADMRILTIATVEQSDISKLSAEYIMAADYIICVPDDMTKTY